MDNNKLNYTYDNIIQVEDESTIASRRFLAGVFSWMFVALLVSAAVSYLFTTNLSLLQLIVNPVTGGLSGLGYLALFSPIAFALVIQIGYNNISYPILALLFIAYASLIGISLSLIFMMYTATSFFSVFIIAAVLFAVMAAAGYYTHTDLTKFGSLMYIGFIGIFVASLVNFFLHSEMMSYIIGYIGAAVFIGLTAYYMQMLKRIGEGVEFGSMSAKKLSLVGALVLYITLINLFMSLLRVFGRRR
jgi:FtsH-binding integral membrane protein